MNGLKEAIRARCAGSAVLIELGPYTVTGK